MDEQLTLIDEPGMESVRRPVDGRAVLSCTTLAVECEGKAIETVEGIAANKNGIR